NLAEHIEVGRITTGLSSLSNAGLVIKGCNDGTACKNGPSVTAGGINAGDKKLTGLADGVLDGDAVNVAQLNKVKEEVIKGSGLIQQGENEDDNGRITIGAGNSSTEINILNKDGVRRTISGISGGKVTEESTEAINGAQLWETNEEVHNLNHRVDETHTNVSQYFGGGADISSGKAPTYTIEGKQYNNVGSAFSAVNDSLDNIQNEISRHFGQIYTISDIFAHYFGGGAGYNNGKWTAPTYEVSHFDVNGASSEKAYNNVSDAFGGVNESMSGMNDRLQEVENKVDQNKAESDSLGWNKDKGAYDASHDGKPGKIVNVADGQIAQGSGDAVNGGQLWETNERVTNVENKVNDVSKQVDKIGNTIIDINNSVIDMGDRVDSIENAVNHFADGAVSYQRDENGKKTNKVVLQGGDSGKPVTIDNVADGKIEKGSQEAVNGGQLHDYTQEQMKLVLNDAKKYTDGKIKNIVVDAIDDAVSQAKGYTDMKFEALSYGIEGARKEARQAAAIGLAVSNLRYNDTPGRLSFAFGSGMWRSQSAFALGTGYTSEDGRIHSNFSATTAGGHWGIGAGVSITLN
ncbi:Vomp family autotransporter, partial [Bartonella bacilliformis]